MKVVILAAGYAVRLNPLTLNTPKSLLVVADKTIMDRIVEKITALKEAGSICIVSNNKFFKNFNDWRKRSGYKARISIINDGSVSNETRLGAIKDLDLAIREENIADDLLVVAGDNLFDMDLKKFLDFAVAHPDGVSVALYDLQNIELARNFGVVAIDENFKVVNFEEKPEEPKSTLISTGIYYFPREKLPLLTEYVKTEGKLDAPGYYISWLSTHHNVYGFKFTEDWYDIGNVESYKKADKEYSEKEKNKK